MKSTLRGAAFVVLSAVLSCKGSVNNDSILVPATYRASLGNGLVQATAGSSEIAVSADGRFAAFASTASNLVPNDPDPGPDIFWIDLFSGITKLVSVSLTGTSTSGTMNARPRISGDGRYVVFTSDAIDYTVILPSYEQVYRRDMVAGVTELVTTDVSGSVEADDICTNPSMSADGRFIAFETGADNLLDPGPFGDDGTTDDVYVRDMTLPDHGFSRLSDAAGGGNSDFDSFGPRLSADGRFAVYESRAQNLISPPPANGFYQIYVRNWRDPVPVNELVSIATDGTIGDDNSFEASVSADGTVVAFRSIAGTLDPRVTPSVFIPQAFARDRRTRLTTCASFSPILPQAANGAITYASVGASGNYVVMLSGATNLFIGDHTGVNPDAVVCYLATGEIRLISQRTFGTQGNGAVFTVQVSAGGAFAAFTSDADNLIDNDTNLVQDAFVHGPLE